MHLRMPPAKRQPFCSGMNELNDPRNYVWADVIPIDLSGGIDPLYMVSEVMTSRSNVRATLTSDLDYYLGPLLLTKITWDYEYLNLYIPIFFPVI